MASPRVFVSSTCYDLGEIRDNLYSFIESFNFIPVLSERGDVFYHPALHTHHSCLREIENCQMFILVIGGRFGSSYQPEPLKSVVNAEFDSARECKIPVFSFVKKDVFKERELFEKNKNKKEIKQIEFPSIENREYAEYIFDFISVVMNSPVNNGIFAFEFVRDIQDILRKQWSGMFFDFLINRKSQKEFEITSDLINNLTIISKKTEELSKMIYKQVDKLEAPAIIDELEKEINAIMFFQELLRKFKVEKFNLGYQRLVSVSYKLPWYEFLEKTWDFRIIKDTEYQGRRCDLIQHINTGIRYPIAGELNEKEKDLINEIEEKFDNFCKLNKSQRKKVLHTFSIKRVAK